MLHRVPGATVIVLEPSTTHIEIGRAQIAATGDESIMSHFDPALLDERYVAADAGTCDFVTMWHVLKHLPEPIGLLRLAMRLLRPGTGRLCVEAPSFADNLMDLSPAYRARHFMAEDVSHFSPVSLGTLISNRLVAFTKKTACQSFSIAEDLMKKCQR